ncbi:MAG: hypothetical protein E6Q87_05280 [Cellvibrionales bacterium]|nr:MAG: hypothetical protein E6Q87_05280 [Cellvibrionales bacterium]
MKKTKKSSAPPAAGKAKTVRDPHHRREAEKYSNPIPSREFILSILENSKGPMDHPALCTALKIRD